MDPSVPPPPPPARYVAPTPPAPSGRWPTPAIVTLAVVVLLGVLGGLVGQLQAKNARDEKAALRRELDQTEGDTGSVLDELRAKVDELTTENSTLTDQAAQAAQAAADLDAAKAKLAEREAQIADLTAQLESAGAASESIAALFPVGLEDLAKVDLAASAMTLTARVGDCTYSAETCDRLPVGGARRRRLPGRGPMARHGAGQWRQLLPSRAGARRDGQLQRLGVHQR